MLGYSGAQELTRSWRRSSEPNDNGEAVVVDLRGRISGASTDTQPVAEPESVIEAASPGVSRNDRRAVGRALRFISHTFDFAAVALPLLAGPIIRFIVNGEAIRATTPLQYLLVVFYGAVGAALLAPTLRRGRLALPASEGLLSIIGRVALAPVITVLAVTILQFVLRASWEAPEVDVSWLTTLVAVTVPLVLIGRLVSSKLVEVTRSAGYDLDDVIIVGTGPIGVQVAEALIDNPQFGLLPTGFVDRFDDEMPLPLLGRPEDLPEILELTGVRHVVLAFGATEEQELVEIIRSCGGQIAQFYAVPRLFELGVSADALGHEVSGLPIVEVRRPGSSAAMWPAKRASDVMVAGILTILALPVMAACALAVRLTSRGPILFKQVRVGIGGQPFEIYKFRTMRVNDDSSTQWTVEGDDRVTLAGKFLRPTHLDELPQLFNVLRGEMSLVGPRPERPHFVEQFSSEIHEYEYRHRVPVGITGWAQVNGYWGDTSIETRVRLDNRYIENWSLWRDLVIGLRTIPTLLGKRR